MLGCITGGGTEETENGWSPLFGPVATDGCCLLWLSVSGRPVAVSAEVVAEVCGRSQSTMERDRMAVRAGCAWLAGVAATAVGDRQ